MSAYSQLKIFNYPAKLASLQRDVLPPLHIRLKPTNACNHRCSYCAYRAPDLQLGNQMDVRDMLPLAKMQELVGDFAEMGVKAVTFSGGGEPLLYPHLGNIVEALADAGLQVASLTNGARLSGDLAQAFAFRAAWVRVSLDGWDGPSYAKYRGVGQGDFDQLIGNLAAFNALGGKCKLSACINVDQTNAPHVYSLIKTLAEQGGVKTIKVTPVIVANDAQGNYDHHKPYVRTVRRQVTLAKESFPKVEIWNDYKAGLASFNKDYHWCAMLQVRPVVGADGWVYSCQDRAYAEGGKLFSIKEQSFLDGWMKGDWRYKIDPSRDCAHHCANDAQNKIIHEFLRIDDKEFV